MKLKKRFTKQSNRYRYNFPLQTSHAFSKKEKIFASPIFILLQILRIQGLTNITYNFPTNETPELFYCISKRRGAGGKKMAFDEGWRRRVDFVTCSRMIRFDSAIRNCIVEAARRRKLRNELFQGL